MYVSPSFSLRAFRRKAFLYAIALVFIVAVAHFIRFQKMSSLNRITPEQAIMIALSAPLDVVNGEIGENDFRISDMGPNGSTIYEVYEPAVAYNSVNNEFLVVWRGDDNTGALVNNEYEIFGQRINAATGAEVGTNDFRISDMGTDGDTAFNGLTPDVAYNSTNNEYLVVWWGDTNTGGLVDGEFEIFGQRLNAATGAEVGANDFRISDMGPVGNSAYRAENPAVAYNSTNNSYLVVWDGDNATDDEFDIYGQQIDAATGLEIGTNDFRISTMGPGGDANYDGYSPAVAYNSMNNEYLVAWYGEETGSLDENEIYGQRLDAATGASVGANDFRISDMGPDGNIGYEARYPAIAYNNMDNQYLVVWHGEDTTFNEYEIYGQRLNAATGAEIGTNDFHISDMGPDGDANYDGQYPSVTYNPVDHEYLVVWQGDDNVGELVVNENEIFGQQIDASTGAEIGANDFRLSDMGPNGEIFFAAERPSVAYGPTNNGYIAVWRGEDDTTPLVDNEYEIFGQRYQNPTPTPTPTKTPTSTPTKTPTPAPVYIPVILKPFPCFSGPDEQEPNSSSSQANGPLCDSGTFTGFPNDQWDIFFFETTTAGQITLDLTNHTGSGVQIQLRDETFTLLSFDSTPPHHLEYSGPAGIYFIAIFTESGFNGSTPYSLDVNFP